MVAGAGEPRGAVVAVERHAVEPLAGAGAVEPPDRADTVELRAMADAVEQDDGADAVKPSADQLHTMVSAVEPHAATGLPSAKLWNALDSNFAAAMDVELAISLSIQWSRRSNFCHARCLLPRHSVLQTNHGCHQKGNILH
ncbi:hypothetical protein ACP70R_045794 [Stipagrostis hirtigluma subsp. patula]